MGLIEAPLLYPSSAAWFRNLAPVGKARLQRDDYATLTWPESLGVGEYGRVVAGLILALTLAKFVVAALTPLSFDEALYWRYSQHLAAGFIDHPFMNPLMIRVGTSLFGQTPFGVRFMAVLLGLPASWAVWRAALSLFEDRKLALTAALFFNLTVVMTAGAVVATSDQIVVVTNCFLMLALTELNRSGRGAWWLAVGVAFGLGLCSKYTTAFFAVSILAWLLIVPGQRRWLLSFWPWLSGAVALALFSPVLIWNAQHEWASLVYQSGRLTIFYWTARYIVELVFAAIILATPPIFVLAAIGVARLSRREDAAASAAVLLLALIAPMAVYFLWHAAHERVQGNWIEPIYPALCIAAAWAAQNARPGSAPWAVWSRRIAAPFALGLAFLIYVQATTGLPPLGRHSPRGRVLAVGWRPLAAEVDRVRRLVGAKAILTTDYTVASWGKFYLPPGTVIEQINQRLRWVNEPAPDDRLFKGVSLYLCRGDCMKVVDVQRRFRNVALVESLERKDGDHRIGTYSIYRLSDPVGPTLDSPTITQTADRDD